jgi:hypothetical protein
MAKSPSATERVEVPSNVLFRELEGECVILNLDTESYFGLDDVGTRMWLALTRSDSIAAALEELEQEFDVEPEQLRRDLDNLLVELVEQGLLERSGA